MNPEMPKEEPVEIPCADLSPDALEGLVAEFILREGTDYGVQEALMETKMKQIFRQLQNGEVKIFFDATSETVSIVPAKKKL